jgi:hypothetical protein
MFLRDLASIRMMFTPLYNAIIIAIFVNCIALIIGVKIFYKRLFPSKKFTKYWVVSSLTFSLIRTIAMSYLNYRAVKTNTVWQQSYFLQFIRFVLSFDFAILGFEIFGRHWFISLLDAVSLAKFSPILEEILWSAIFFVGSLFISLILVLAVMIVVFRKQFERKAKYQK